MLHRFKDRAVTLTHVPTGVKATCDSQRSQHRNKANAEALLKARMWALKNLPEPQSSVLASYVLHGDLQYPENLEDFRRLPAKASPRANS